MFVKTVTNAAILAILTTVTAGLCGLAQQPKTRAVSANTQTPFSSDQIKIHGAIEKIGLL